MATTLSTNAQELNTHRWNNRVLLIFAENDNDPTFTEQLKELNSDIEGLKERKLIVYQIFPSHYKTGYAHSNETIKPDESIFKKYSTPSDPFKAVLIGLDGGVKYEKSGLLKNKVLFAIIDGMPMRKAELNNN
ncbi:DUF4174 domain-containing protein [Fulvivirga lutimaris]|uniref:DUF4174 domain-containing protein n=1 Tax=Fulvivirga lutimaris TaxID=1819566 RepID=UPI0012BBA4CF|nr:DUF4174 domain-containing protein [Fulvivirga lutimaris]MTI41857.1 DUF4174 domain-containing protein [Fulvivirga lutimaris]